MGRLRCKFQKFSAEISGRKFLDIYCNFTGNLLKNFFHFIHFYRANALMQRKLLPRPSCLSVSPSIFQMHALQQNERNLCPHSYTT